VRFYGEPPSDGALRRRVKMMLLWRQRLRTNRSNTSAASFAVIDAGKWRSGPGFVCRVVFLAVFVHKEIRVFVVCHTYSPRLTRLFSLRGSTLVHSIIESARAIGHAGGGTEGRNECAPLHLQRNQVVSSPDRQIQAGGQSQLGRHWRLLFPIRAYVDAISSGAADCTDYSALEVGYLCCGRVAPHFDQGRVAARVIKARGHEPLHAEIAHVAECHRTGGWVVRIHDRRPLSI